jgi:nucleotide-binding universal stress UspA family protein
MASQTKHYGIIVGVDGSPASDSAVSWAAHDAAMHGVTLTLMHVENPAAPTWAQAPILEELEGWQQAEGRSVLAKAFKIAHDIVPDDAGVPINGELLFSATVPTLIDLSDDADLIVVGTDGRGALTRDLLGSVSSGLVRHAHCPIAVVREEESLKPYSAQDPVLVGIDGSPASELATKIAFDEASRRHVGLIALHAWSDRELVEIAGVDWSEIKTDEERLLSEALAGWQERYPDVVVTKQLVCDRPARALVDASRSAQLVVVGSHGRNVVSRTILGSVSNAVVQSARRPVIVARPSG